MQGRLRDTNRANTTIWFDKLFVIKEMTYGGLEGVFPDREVGRVPRLSPLPSLPCFRELPFARIP